MKAFLMHRDRDFDLQRLLPWNEAALTQDLALGTLFDAMGAGDAFLSDVARKAVLSSLTDIATIQYRQRVLQDCLTQEAVIREMYRLAVEAIEGEKKSYWGWFSPKFPSGVLHRAVDALQMFVGMLRRLRHIADRHATNFKSEALVQLFTMLREELSDAYFATIEDHLRRLRFRGGVLVSAGLGKGNKGMNYVLRRSPDVKPGWLQRIFGPTSPGYTYNLHPRDETGARCLSELKDRGVNLVANALAQSTDHILSFFQMLRTELAFYVGCLNLRQRLREKREPMCFPIAVTQGRTYSAIGLYDVCLTLSIQHRVVGNDIEANNKDLLIVTGANQGGKSTFLRSTGLAQLMMQAGMFVPARSFRAEVRDGVFTHYKREEDPTMKSGKLDEELSRMDELANKLNPNAMALFNESFAATNEREGSEIARQISSALVESGVKVFFVTHLYDFARSFYEKRTHNTLFLRAERRSDGQRTFRVVEGEPLETSYGKDLYDNIFRSGRGEHAVMTKPISR
jgi:ABC-type histidine transport system ATPase subunit